MIVIKKQKTKTKQNKKKQTNKQTKNKTKQKNRVAILNHFNNIALSEWSPNL